MPGRPRVATHHHDQPDIRPAAGKGRRTAAPSLLRSRHCPRTRRTAREQRRRACSRPPSSSRSTAMRVGRQRQVAYLCSSSSVSTRPQARWPGFTPRAIARDRHVECGCLPHRREPGSARADCAVRIEIAHESLYGALVRASGKLVSHPRCLPRRPIAVRGLSVCHCCLRSKPRMFRSSSAVAAPMALGFGVARRIWNAMSTTSTATSPGGSGLARLAITNEDDDGA